MATIAHIDADCFYISCERIRYPGLRGRAVGVLGNQGACVIARSYEMKARGVKVGMPIWQAKRICPEGIYVKRDFRFYAEVSYRMQDIFKKFSDKVEFYSVDESFIDLSRVPGDMEKLAKEIKDTIWERVGVPVTVGIAPTKVLAKLLVKDKKPNGYAHLKEDNVYEFLKGKPVGNIWGISKGRGKTLENIGVSTCFDFVNLSRDKVKQFLNKPGEQIWYELQGLSLFKVNGEKPFQKTLSRGGSLSGTVYEKDEVYAYVVRNLERLVDKCFRDGIEIGGITLILRDQNMKKSYHQMMLPNFTSNFFDLLKGYKRLFEKIYKKDHGYKYMHVIAYPLRSKHLKQLSIFEELDHKKEEVDVLLKKLNFEHGNFTVRSGATLYLNDLYRDEASNFEITDIEGKVCF